MKFLDLFAGIGGFRLGMESAGHECIGFCEIDKFARTSYKAIHDTTGEVEMHDITTISDEFIRGIGSVDVICGGFPCQAFSIAGKRKGFEDTRGTLFFEIARFASILRPRYLFLENVKGLLNHEGGATFETILRALDELGYDVEWQVLNSKDYVPQNRERVFIIGHLRGERTRKVFPFERKNGTTAKNNIRPINNSKKTRELLNFDSTNRFYDVNGISPCLNTMQGGDREPKIAVVGNVNPSGSGMNGQVYSSNGLAPTLTTNKGEGAKIAIPVLTPDRVEKRQNGRRFKDDGEEMFTLTAQDKHGVAIIQKSRGYNDGGIYKVAPTVTSNSWHENNFLKDSIRIRKLTPRECWRLQGFPDWAFDKAKEVNSDSQLYKQAGNSVTMPVIADIASRLESE
ncbi:DNA (cytosine-5-)-methyltransferase [Enterococcus faecalis]|uniref:DNA cytosine methyltransferase n=1 Tax=Enterococcus faecalis TaxID=1351 RepID=UPI0001F0D4B1|nr:DNA (cytosine-5-)-methyltransferase [Enterococcus faecalis]DAI07562.1 MAG TPA: Cytosine specific methyltransferase [Caudoviricetes sp.]EFU06229.1 DNA (cytosine-5-)-methyltransferase [Enterococcus faecalis TX0645]EGS7860814.1 DNA (cytosine-5-)-methyltransferase [Enterococcus faecalis]EHV0159374.1 DNA (cytosine-5-)-methyltransferase [Enterococcus faecalis]EHV0174794.1 DNA (cytosine-5-)-methyltransferase [Enterococcus faecalis]